MTEAEQELVRARSRGDRGALATGLLPRPDQADDVAQGTLPGYLPAATTLLSTSARHPQRRTMSYRLQLRGGEDDRDLHPVCRFGCALE